MARSVGATVTWIRRLPVTGETPATYDQVNRFGVCSRVDTDVTGSAGAAKWKPEASFEECRKRGGGARGAGDIIQDRGSTNEGGEKAEPSRARKALAIIGKPSPDEQYNYQRTERLLSFLGDIKVGAIKEGVLNKDQKALRPAFPLSPFPLLFYGLYAVISP